jgi:dTDP-4-amino-4,6-dideoxygalactose transaminase
MVHNFSLIGDVLTLGAVPVFVDMDHATYLMDIHQLESSITPRRDAGSAVAC